MMGRFRVPSQTHPDNNRDLGATSVGLRPIGKPRLDIYYSVLGKIPSDAKII